MRDVGPQHVTWTHVLLSHDQFGPCHVWSCDDAQADVLPMYPLLAASHDRVPADFHMLQYLSFTAETPVLQHMQIDLISAEYPRRSMGSCCCCMCANMHSKCFVHACGTCEYVNKKMQHTAHNACAERVQHSNAANHLKALTAKGQSVKHGRQLQACAV